jgi:hypothetical protein
MRMVEGKVVERKVKYPLYSPVRMWRAYLTQAEKLFGPNKDEKISKCR